MENFRIKRLRVSGPGKIDGIVDFTDGLNVILGRSNTGKTWILKCIYYLFSSDKKPFSHLTGYKNIEGTFLTDRFGTVIISRNLGEEFATVQCNDDRIINGSYRTNYLKEAPLYLNDLWLRIIGLSETIKIPSSARYARERISWTNIANVFWADEGEIDKAESIVFKDQKYDTALISSLYFLLTGDYKEGVQEILKPEVASAAKKAVVDYVDEQVASLTDKKSSYIKQLEEMEGEDIDARMAELSEDIENTQNEIKELLAENEDYIAQQQEYKQSYANCGVLVDRYESLISQYKADLQRLDFISKGQKAVQELPTNGVCPFCGGELHPEEDDGYSDAISAEIKRIASELTVIVATEKNVKDEQSDIKKALDEIQTHLDDVAAALRERNSQIHGYRADLQRYRDYTTLQNGIDFVNEQLSVLGEKKVATQKKKKNPPLYHAKEEFENYVGSAFDKLLNQILKECNYRAGYASWDFSTANVLMDGVSKSEDQGKGYCSFLNSVTALMLYEYFNDDGVYIKPGFLMVDTPLLGLDLDEEVEGETFKNGLYHYFLNHAGNGQVILVDNLNMVPNIDFKTYGVNVVTYYKDEKEGHIYGFLPSWRKDLPRENKK
ncbi:hypothetical protein [Muricomes intestini]|uniref:hypothetical protein n=1 Tax=Muricomes intestini TaxID=1796634 RepID=UPI002FDF636E